MGEVIGRGEWASTDWPCCSSSSGLEENGLDLEGRNLRPHPSSARDKYAGCWPAWPCFWGGITFATAGGNRFRWHTIVAWIGACGCWVLAFAERPNWTSANRGWLGADGLRLHLRWRHLALLAVFLLAAWFRFYRLDDLPGEMTIDHPHKLLDIRDVLRGEYRIFFPRNTGRELFQFYYTATLVRVFGLPLSFQTLKLGTVLVSLAAVGGTYALAAELFGPQAGLSTAAFLAISRWDLGISRIGLRYPFASLPLAIIGLFLFRALRTGRRNDALWCGLSLGLGLHGYSSFRVVPGLVVTAVLLKALLDREGVQRIGRRRFWVNAALIPALAALAFMPLGRYMLDHPDMFWYRVLTRTSGLERQLPDNPISVFLSNVAQGLLAFNWRGDVGWVHLVQRLPFLDPLSGALFVLGVGATALRLLRYRDWRSGCLLAGLPILLLPSSLSLAFPVENPSANRSSAAIPLVFTFVGLAPGLLLRATRGIRSRAAQLTAALCLILLLGTAGYLNYQSYFVRYAAQFNTYAWNASELAQVIRGFAAACGSLDQAYIAPWPYFADGRAVALELGNWEWYNLLDDLTGLSEQAAQPGNKLYLVHFSDRRSLDRLRETYPQAQVRRYQSSTPGHDFWIVFVPE
ncbi:MAG: glycosyltransferase family 39 protein [Chloroflexota bacterium]|nr:glycosyltransferase family 39 protein [Chloroflexota bacterium]